MPKPEMKMVETGKAELIVKVPNISQENALIIARDVKYTLETCAGVKRLNEFTQVVKVEYAEVPVKEAK